MRREREMGSVLRDEVTKAEHARGTRVARKSGQAYEVPEGGKAGE